MTSRLGALAKETKAKGWWQSISDVYRLGFEVFLGLEEAAASFDHYEVCLVPGLLQTEAYARAIMTHENPTLSAEDVDGRVQVRMARQALLTRQTRPLQFSAVIGEATFRCPIGGRQVMAEQLDRLVKVTDLENVDLRVVPFEAGMHSGIASGPFILLRFPVTVDGRETEPPTVYTESLTGAVYLDKPDELARYYRAWDSLQSASLDETASKNRIEQAAREMRQ
jgi:hypothetical protein